LGGFGVESPNPGEFHVTHPGGDRAFISLANQLPAEVTLDGITARGDALRCLVARANGSRITAIGAHQIAGICETEMPGTVHLERDPSGTVRVTTDTGLTLDAAWGGATGTRVHVRALDDTWVDVTDATRAGAVPHALVREWAKRNERNLIEFLFDNKK
jgi:hypothetical protein